MFHSCKLSRVSSCPSIEGCHISFKGCTFVTSVFVVLSAISSDKITPGTVFTFKNLLEQLLGLFKFLCFHSSLCLTCCYTGQVSRPGALAAFECFPHAGSSQLSKSLPPEEEPWALPDGAALAVPGTVSTQGTAPAPQLTVPGAAELLQQGLCSTSQSLGGSCISSSSRLFLCSWVLKSFIIPLTACAEINFCWRTELQYLPINCQDFALRFFLWLINTVLNIKY